MKDLRGMLPFFGVIILDFYLLPLLIKDTGSAMLVILIAVPLICFVCSFFYGLKNPFSWLYIILIVLLFFPSIFIFYNSTAWVYAFAYGMIALIGSFLGRTFAKVGKKV